MAFCFVRYILGDFGVIQTNMMSRRLLLNMAR